MTIVIYKHIKVAHSDSFKVVGDGKINGANRDSNSESFVLNPST